MAMRDLLWSTDCLVGIHIRGRSKLLQEGLRSCWYGICEINNQSVMSHHSKNIQPSQADWQSEKFCRHVIGGGTG
jgi:hypothetical protein